MDAKHIQLVQESFARLAPTADTTAALFYARLFELDPRLARLFPSDLAGQGRKLLATLRVAVHSLNQPATLERVLKDLGRRHAAYGVAPDDYDTVACALLWTLAHSLGAVFTPEVEAAWTALYTRLAGLMQAGALEPAGYAASTSAAAPHSPAA